MNLLAQVQYANGTQGLLQWWPLLLGWPAVVLGLGLAIAGLAYRRSALLVSGAVAIAPFSLYLGGGIWWALGLPGIPVLAAAAMRSGRSRIAWLLIAFLGAVFVRFALMVFVSNQLR